MCTLNVVYRLTGVSNLPSREIYSLWMLYTLLTDTPVASAVCSMIWSSLNWLSFSFLFLEEIHYLFNYVFGLWHQSNLLPRFLSYLMYISCGSLLMEEEELLPWSIDPLLDKLLHILLLFNVDISPTASI